MRKIRTRIWVGGAVAVFAGAATFAAVTVAGVGNTNSTVALTTAANGTTATGTAATGTAKAATTLSISVAKSSVVAGRLDVIKGTLGTGSLHSGRRVVELYRYDAKKNRWVPARANLTRKEGTVRFAVRPVRTGQYELVYHGSGKLAPVHSSPVTITVHS